MPSFLFVDKREPCTMKLTREEFNLVFFFLFITFAKKKKNRKNVGRDTATAVANYSGPG